MKSTRKDNMKVSTHSATKQSEAPVFGQPDHHTLRAIDQLAEQMMMPRSWVVTQILREWAEGRMAELRELEQSWNGSYREHLARSGAEA